MVREADPCQARVSLDQPHEAAQAGDCEEHKKLHKLKARQQLAIAAKRKLIDAMPTGGAG